ncbi:hypothetical protein SETIT_1G234000v2 [Setaria italica]|uniref:Uncharacterized protein n=1 Tax=Setaria italica TaxID=4555 RepID=K3YWW6_SETIT|nr:hypothetical protein SETIT_1G234000v2 [Setaria italica]RCV07314.1 hypothetical protein SETIT_1G234000v2 [Setaria italica]
MASTLHPLACNKTAPMDLHVWRWVPSVGATAVRRRPGVDSRRRPFPSCDGVDPEEGTPCLQSQLGTPQILPQMRPHSNLNSNLESVPLRWLSTSLRSGRHSWCTVGRHSPCP